MWRGLVIIVRLPFFLMGLIVLTLIGLPFTVGHNAVTFVLTPFLAPFDLLSSLLRNKPEEMNYYRNIAWQFVDPWKELKRRYSTAIKGGWQRNSQITTSVVTNPSAKPSFAVGKEGSPHTLTTGSSRRPRSVLALLCLPDGRGLSGGR
jgi:hypothetical protein